VDGDEPKKPSPVVDEEMVRSLARLLDETRLTEIEIEHGGVRVRVARQAAAMAYAPAPAADPRAPLAIPAGVLDPAQHPGAVASRWSAPPTARPSPAPSRFCEVGTVVKAGDTLLIIEAMKTLNQIPAPKAGTVAQILFEDAQAGGIRPTADDHRVISGHGHV